MRLRYYHGTLGNALYGGAFLHFGRYMTFGLHSFIYDFVRCARRTGVELDLVVDDLERFPLTIPLSRVCRLTALDNQNDLAHPDAIMLDTVSDEMLHCVVPGVPALAVVHNAGEVFSPAVLARADRLVCMTSNAFELQARRVDVGRLVLIHQGVDLCRFRPASPTRRSAGIPHVLWYTRLGRGKRDVIVSTIEQVLEFGYPLTVLGDGEAFWGLSDRFGEHISLVNHSPCHSMHNFIARFDVVISSGRGVMEALASDIPAICAGFGYAGLVEPHNIESLLRYNLTGFRINGGFERVGEDIARAMSLPSGVCREMAVTHLDGEVTVSAIIDAARSVSV